MNVGLCTISNKDAGVEDVLATAARAGYDGVEIWGQAAHIGDGSAADCERLADRAAELGLEVPVYGSYLRLGTDEFDDELERELGIAEALGASLIRVWAGTQEYQERTADHWDRAVGDLRTLSRRAAARDLGVTVEKHGGTLTNRGEGARRLVEAADDDRCGLNWQPLFGLPPDELAAEARSLAPYSNNVHVQAVSTRGGADRSLLEDAYFDCAEVLAPFRDGPFDGYVEVEFVTGDHPYETAVQRDLSYLRSVLD